MNGRLHPWTLFIDAQAVLIGIGVVLVVVLVAVTVLRWRRAAKSPQDGG